MLRLRKLVPALATVAVTLTGCSGQQLLNTLTPSGGYRLHSDIDYGVESRQTLDVYTPVDVDTPAPVVVFFYGGRWSDGSKDGYPFVAQALTSRGYVAVVPDYRLYPQVRFPAFVEDGAHAVAWVMDHIDEYGGDPRQVFLMGHSSGAHIAAMLTLDEHYLAAQGVAAHGLSGMIGLAGPYDFLPLEANDLKDMFGPPSRYGSSQPIRFVGGDESPLLLLHGLDDNTVSPSNTRHLAKVVADAGGSVETVLYPGEDHVGVVASLAAPLRFSNTVLSDVARFVDRESRIVARMRRDEDGTVTTATDRPAER